MKNYELLLRKMKKEDEMLVLQQEVLYMEQELDGKDRRKAIERIQKKRGELCFNKTMLEMTVKSEQVVA